MMSATVIPTEREKEITRLKKFLSPDDADHSDVINELEKLKKEFQALMTDLYELGFLSAETENILELIEGGSDLRDYVPSALYKGFIHEFRELEGRFIKYRTICIEYNIITEDNANKFFEQKNAKYYPEIQEVALTLSKPFDETVSLVSRAYNERMETYEKSLKIGAYSSVAGVGLLILLGTGVVMAVDSLIKYIKISQTEEQKENKISIIDPVLRASSSDYCRQMFFETTQAYAELDSIKKISQKLPKELRSRRGSEAEGGSAPLYGDLLTTDTGDSKISDYTHH